MGDGGVACMPLQQQQHIMERFPIADKTLCGGKNNNSSSSNNNNNYNNNNNINNNNNNSSSNNGVNSKSVKQTGTQQPRKKVKIVRVVKVKKVGSTAKKGEAKKAEVKLEKEGKNCKEAENGGVDKAANKEDVEEGELGTLKWTDNEEIVQEKSRRSETEKGENSTEKRKKGEVEKGEIIWPKWRKGDVEKRDIGMDNGRRSDAERIQFVSWRDGREDIDKGRRVEADKVESGSWREGRDNIDKGRRSEVEKGEYGSWRDCRDEIEKGEFIPDRWDKRDVLKDDYSYSKFRRYDTGKDRGWKFEQERTSPSGKYPGDDICRRKEHNRSVSQHSKSSSRWEGGQDRNMRTSSKTVDEEGSYGRNEYSNGKNHGREYSFGLRVKRHGTDSVCSDRKHYGEYGDYASLKSRRLSDDSNRMAHSEHYSVHSMERSFRNSSSSRISALDKYSARHHESPLSSRVVYDRHGQSPSHSERSPRERARYYDHRDRSPARRERSPYGRDKSPYVRDRSPYARERSPYVRERSPYVLQKSPFDRGRHYDHRNRSPFNAERSPQDQARLHDRRDRAPSYSERSPFDRSRPSNNRETSRKSGASEKHNSQYIDKGQEDKLNEKDPNARDSHFSSKESQDRTSVHNHSGLDEKNSNSESHKEEQSQSQSTSVMCKESPHAASATPEEPPSMEEDMDICDTPPHVPVVANSSSGRWFYLDQFGVECGPSNLCDLKAHVEEGYLVSDHLIKHLDSDRWVTVENAVSPVLTVNFQSIVADSISQLVMPPEASGNLLAEAFDAGQSGIQSGEQMQITSPQQICSSREGAAASEPSEDLHIDKRVEALLEGYTVIPGKELETVGEVLQISFEHAQWEEWGNSEGLIWHPVHTQEQSDEGTDQLPVHSDTKSLEAAEFTFVVSSDKDYGFTCSISEDWFSDRWSCKGGDWKRNDEASQDRSSRKKLVLNDGFPLCQMPKSGYEDPRWHQKDDLYHPLQGKKLELPPWAFSCPDDRSDCSAVSKSTQSKLVVGRVVKGIMLPVVRINACVVNDHGSFVSEPRSKVRGKDRFSSRSTRPYSASGDAKRSSADSDTQSRVNNDQDSLGSWKRIASINTPKDRLCTFGDLQLHLGDWYYLDGIGHERGPLSFAELQALVAQGVIQKYSSVYRKFDKIWVPIASVTETSDATGKIQLENSALPGDFAGSHSLSLAASLNENNTSSSSFHSLHPQFIGYTRGKLHEFVMKSYKSREFAVAINEVLDPWINAKQPKKDTEKHIYRKSGDLRAGKRARMLLDGSEEDYEMEEEMQTVQKDETTFEDLRGDASFHAEGGRCSETDSGNWGLLDGHMLARVFHFLRSDLKSLGLAALTCKHWRAAVSFYKDISRQVDLSSLGPNCTDSVIWNIMNGYNKENISSVVLIGCTNITSSMLEEILRYFPCLSSIDVRGCSQFEELALQFPNVNWLKTRSLRGTKIYEESHSKIRSLKQITDKTSSISKTKGLDNDMDDFGELKDYFDSVDKRDSANQVFRRNLYKRSKLFDARRSSSILPRDARMRRWSIKKSENGYKRMEEFLASSLKGIMRENNFDFFVPKVAEIEERMKNGYYIGHGLNSVKEDISRMCRDAIKANNRGGSGDMNHIITLFIQLAARLEEGSKSSYYEREKMLKSWKDDLSSGFCSAGSKFKKKLGKVGSDKKYMNRSNGTSFANGGLDYGEYASDREIHKRLSKLNRKSLDSGSETSDDLERSTENDKSDSGSTASDTESDVDFQTGRSGESRGDGYFTADEGFDAMSDEREWGARMTKASLVPPVTRKYEVIDQYAIVADEEEVQRKMRVSLPEDYAEKLSSQKNGTEELDMELPEVKDYKPRKLLGNEVIEQEVYGIDPYTHNLLLDSMPEELNWPLLEKHLFIEDVLLRTLNKQVRHFTGSGGTPMMYPLQPVLEEIERAAEVDCNIKTVKMCQAILKAIDSRPDDNYVAYRKGLGVVCDKEGGFGDDDFIVEFLGEVYPVWKWFEKQDGIRSLQKNSNDPAPEFYNIYLERPKGDADGYDLVVVDAMHKANYASRICHSCRPNCEAKVTAVDGQYQIGIYSVREIQYGEEITFDYNSVTESKEEYEASVCLCGSQVCRGSYLNLTGEGAFQKVLKEWHGFLYRHHLMIEACVLNSVSEDDYLDLGRAGLGSCLLGGLPDWVVAYTARLVRFLNFERTKLPEEILKHNLEEKRKYFSDICLEVEKSDAEVQAEGVYNQRLQNLAVTLDKVRYVMRCVFGDPKKAPPPLEKLNPEEVVSHLWKGEGSLVEELLQCMSTHVEEDLLNDLKFKIHAHDPTGSDNIHKQLQKSLLWLRDEVRNLPCTYKCRHDAAADLIHTYAYTKCFFRVREYKCVTSLPVYISPLDLGPKYSDKMGPDFQEYRKTYGENYCLGQLIFWHNQTNAEPDCSLARASRGCLSLPDIGSFYAKAQKPSRHRVYGPKTLRFMLARMEKQPQRVWPNDRIWSFKNSPKVFGSPMLDAVLNNSPLDMEMVQWLKHRPAIFQAMWDR
ncbi:SET domain-containing protein [Cephalotus follicularis]|uniref:SET domain-containing protein n=1 Tax=Cephalotus follicularis TaxID=3775 RepID=A0A1Q3D7J6_CEPFO|nr:SET domain-containing protein [Cephalotus follicularis]